MMAVGNEYSERGYIYFLRILEMAYAAKTDKAIRARRLNRWHEHCRNAIAHMKDSESLRRLDNLSLPLKLREWLLRKKDAFSRQEQNATRRSASATMERRPPI